MRIDEFAILPSSNLNVHIRRAKIDGRTKQFSVRQF
jgi:hypothetical protein